MEELTIKRNINNQTYSFTLTEDELEQAYRIKEKRYRDEDFANLMAQNPDSKFRSGHLEEFPELTDWLCECFDNFLRCKYESQRPAGSYLKSPEACLSDT